MYFFIGSTFHQEGDPAWFQGLSQLLQSPTAMNLAAVHQACFPFCYSAVTAIPCPGLQVPRRQGSPSLQKLEPSVALWFPWYKQRPALPAGGTKIVRRGPSANEPASHQGACLNTPQVVRLVTEALYFNQNPNNTVVHQGLRTNRS